MIVGLDTSVVLRLLLGVPEDQSQTAKLFLDGILMRGGRVHVSNLVLAEAYFALQFHYQVPKAEALKSLRLLVTADEVQCSEAALAVLQTDGLASAKPGFVDRLIHGEYLSAFDGMVTFEKAGKKLPKTTVL